MLKLRSEGLVPSSGAQIAPQNSTCGSSTVRLFPPRPSRRRWTICAKPYPGWANPSSSRKKHNNTLIFRVQPTGLGAGEIHLKVEINCKEHFSVFPMVRVPFSVENDWFSGQCEVLTYELDELVGTKGLDLFDVYTALITDKLNLDRVMTVYDRYLRFVASHAPTYKEFVLNMDEKMHNPEFLGDITDLLRPSLTFDPQPAWEKVREDIVSCLIK